MDRKAKTAIHFKKKAGFGKDNKRPASSSSSSSKSPKKDWKKKSNDKAHGGSSGGGGEKRNSEGKSTKSWSKDKTGIKVIKKPFNKDNKGKKSADGKTFNKSGSAKDFVPAGQKRKAGGDGEAGEESGGFVKKGKGKSAPTESKNPGLPTYNKPHSALVEHLKEDWNRVRAKATTASDRDALVAKMLKSIQGVVLQVTCRHDVSRIVQSVFQFGKPAQKSALLAELAPKLLEISKSAYGHFAVLKAIAHCTLPSDQKKIVSAFSGHFLALASNVIGVRTVETVLQLMPPAVTRTLKAEFYGKNFRILMAEPPRSLSSALEALPTKKAGLLDHMKEIVLRFVNKKVLQFSFVHSLVWEYVQVAVLEESPKRMDELVNLMAESCLQLMSTKPGAKVVCALISHSSAKDRKRIMKTMKGHMMESLLHHSAFLPVIRLIDVTDDTINVQKTLLQEIKSTVPDVKYSASGDVLGVPVPPLVALALHAQGSKMLLRLLSPAKRHLEPDEELLFASEPTTSKKSSAARRKEHVLFLRSALVSVVAKYAELLVRSRSGCKVLMETIEAFSPASVKDAVSRVLVGLPVNQIADEEEEEEQQDLAGDDDEFIDEEGEEAGEEEEFEEGDGAEDALEEEGEEEVEEEEEADIENIEGNDFEEVDEEEDADDSTSGKAAAAPAVLLPVEEDPIAHSLLKSIVEFDKVVEGVVSETKARADVDRTLWEEEEAEGAGSVSLLILKNLQESEQVVSWCERNRPSHALSLLATVPSTKKTCKAIFKDAAVTSAIKAGVVADRSGSIKLQESIKAL